MIKKYLKIEIINFYKGTFFFQLLLIFGLVILLGINLGFNEKLCSWLSWQYFIMHNDLFLKYEDLSIIDIETIEKIVTIYFYVVLFSITIIVNGIFILIPIIKYYYLKKYVVSTD